MRAPDWRTLRLEKGILAEPTGDDGRIVVWLPDGKKRGYRYWERVGTPAQPVVTRARGVCATEAVGMRARRPAGLFGPIRRLLGRVPEERMWVMPGGRVVERTGERRADLALAWSENPEVPLDEARVRRRWPDCRGVKTIAPGMLLVEGVQPRSAGPVEAPKAASDASPRALAEQALAESRDLQDRRGEVVALVDLGTLIGQEGDAKGAAARLEEAVAAAEKLGDKTLIVDATGQLGLARLALGEPWRALELLEKSRADAAEIGDAPAEKLALERLGLAFSAGGDGTAALTCFERALGIARKVGDQAHEGTLLWLAGIEFARQGQRERAAAAGQRAIEAFAGLRDPRAALYDDHLRRYLAASQAPPPLAPALLGGAIDASAASAGAYAPQGDPATAPGLLQMAYTAARSLGRFLGSGLKTTPADLFQARIESCHACEHYTGLRCRACGCFLEAKARMLHESCPLRKWPEPVVAEPTQAP